MKTDNDSLDNAYDVCLELAQRHYENFPVASFLVPKSLRRPIAAIYAFARTADDIADEGELLPAQRIEQLDHYQTKLDAIAHGDVQESEPIFIALADVIKQHQLPISLLSDLLTAFRQDISKKDYSSWQEVLEYCHYSANPVGRLLLHLDQSNSDALLKQSDAICTALQLINFFQDVQQDYIENNRVYLANDIDESVSLRGCIAANDSLTIAKSIRQQYLLSLRLFEQGYLLGTELNGRLGWEIRSITLSGLFMLKQLSTQTDGSLFSRPRISKLQLSRLCLLTLSKSVFRFMSKQLIKQIVQLNKTPSL